MSISKQGFVEIQRGSFHEAKETSLKLCSPRHFSVEEYKVEHFTPPSVFFDRVHMNLLRIAVRTLASTRSNDALALSMVDHTILKTSKPQIVEDKEAYIVAQKLIRDRDLIGTNYKNVPFFKTPVISQLSQVLYDQMTLYAANETILLLKLDSALGRMADMNKNFEDARLQRELYFEEEQKTLDMIWAAKDQAWNWTFDSSRMMEESIQESIEKNGQEMFDMNKMEMEEMLERAKDTVKSDQATVTKLKAEISRYSEVATKSIKAQRAKLDDLNKAGEDIKVQKAKLDSEIEKWKRKQIINAIFGFFLVIVKIAVSIATMQPEIAAEGVAEGAEVAKEAVDIKKIFENIEKVVEVLKSIDEVFKAIEKNVDDSIPDIGADLALNISLNWRSALENAYAMKDMSEKFSDIRIQGEG